MSGLVSYLSGASLVHFLPLLIPLSCNSYLLALPSLLLYSYPPSPLSPCLPPVLPQDFLRGCTWTMMESHQPPGICFFPPSASQPLVTAQHLQTGFSPHVGCIHWQSTIFNVSHTVLFLLSAVILILYLQKISCYVFFPPPLPLPPHHGPQCCPSSFAISSATWTAGKAPGEWHFNCLSFMMCSLKLFSP